MYIFSIHFYYFRKPLGPSFFELVLESLFEPHVGLATLKLAVLVFLLYQLYSFTRCDAE